MNTKQKIFILIIFVFLVGLGIGKYFNFLTVEKCDYVEHGRKGCYDGCKFSNLPSKEYDSCVMFCKQHYYIEYIESKKICNKWQKFVR